ncbi:MAG: hypothetical protein ACTH31_03895 [Pseudoclavibacter sp.]
MRITIGGVVFDELPSDYDSEFVVEPNGLSGWFGASGIRREETQRPAAHGSFDSRGYRGAKVPFVRGSILASSDATFQAMRQQLEGLLADGSMARMSVQDNQGHVTWQDVRLAQPAVVTPHPNDPSGEYQIGFWAPRAELYGEERVKSGSSADLFHRGTIPAPLRVRIGSGASSYTITSPLGTFEVSGATSGGAHVVDLRTGRVTRNGALLTGVVARAETWDLPRGLSTTHTISAGTGVEWITRDTFA